MIYDNNLKGAFSVVLVGLFVDLYMLQYVGLCASVNSRMKSKHYGSRRYPPLSIGHSIQTMRGWDGGGEGGQEGERERMGGWTKLSVLEHSGLTAI